MKSLGIDPIKDVEKGIILFNEGKFYEAHEAWEKVWRMLRERPESHIIQGLIMIAAALTHYQRKEYAGTVKLIERGIEILSEKRKNCIGINIDDFIEQVEDFRKKFLTDAHSISERDFPTIKKYQTSYLSKINN